METNMYEFNEIDIRKCWPRVSEDSTSMLSLTEHLHQVSLTTKYKACRRKRRGGGCLEDLRRKYSQVWRCERRLARLAELRLSHQQGNDPR